MEYAQLQGLAGMPDDIYKDKMNFLNQQRQQTSSVSLIFVTVDCFTYRFVFI